MRKTFGAMGGVDQVSGPGIRFIVSFVLLCIFNSDRGPGCSPQISCPLALWMLRTSRLGAAIERVSRREVALDVFTPCVLPVAAAKSQSGVTVRIHARMPDQLAATAKRVPKSTPAGSPRVLLLTLQKWVAVSLVDAEFAVCLDLDVDIFVPALAHYANEVAAAWLDTFARMTRIGAQLASMPDHSSPINAGFMILRPNATLYAEGLQLLAHADTQWSVAAGWDLLGPPQSVVPLSDAMQIPNGLQWSATYRWMARQKWDFVGAPLDQGFFFHMCVFPTCLAFGFFFFHMFCNYIIGCFP